MGFPSGTVIMNRLPIQETQATRVLSLDWEGPWRRKWQPRSSILAWKIPRTEEPEATVHGVSKESEKTEHTHI